MIPLNTSQVELDLYLEEWLPYPAQEDVLPWLTVQLQLVSKVSQGQALRPEAEIALLSKEE